MKMCKTELTNLTGRTNSSESDAEDADSESESTPTRSSHNRLVFDFSQNVDHPTNVKVFDQVSKLIWTEQQNPDSETFSLPHKDEPSALGVVNGRRSRTKTLASKQAKSEWDNRQLMRRRELKDNRLKAVPKYKKIKRHDPAFILETDWMTDEISQPDTDDEDKKAAHRRRLVREARLNATQTEDPLWERVRPGFQSSEMQEIKDVLDAILRQPGKKRPRNRVRRVDLGAIHNRIPRANVEGNPDLEEEMKMYDSDPEGFGEA
ncbi:hypothetical protein DFH09DRAFT_1364289 [Mycena vulgaris]|nr:hypothetical protein DFH09DRAFT_1364289 [Mycena vulgaris]